MHSNETISSASCQYNECPLSAIENEDYCSLHANNSTLTGRSFYDALIDYIVHQIFSAKDEQPNFNRQTVKNGLSSQPDNTLSNRLKQITLVLDGIAFPANSSNAFHYKNILELFDGLHFRNCIFKDNDLEVSQPKLLFDGCEFCNWWLVNDHKLLPNSENALYINCLFNNEVNILGPQKTPNIIESPLFSNCEFRGRLTLVNSQLKAPVFNNKGDQKLSIQGTVHIENCTFDDRFCLNNHNINKINLRENCFRSKVELKNNDINSLKIIDCNFSDLFDCYGSKIANFGVEKCIFDGLAIFEKCVFGDSETPSPECTRFTHSTFNQLIIMRKARFLSGLDISTINFREFPNFFKVDVEPENTNRETFRIIKHSFDKVGNYIEGNRFFAEEMKKYREELRKEGTFQEKLIFMLNHGISNFGQNYIYPLAWLVLSLVIYSVVIYGYQQNWLYGVSPEWDRFWSMTSTFLNRLANNLLPVQRFLMEGLEFVSLVFYVIFIVLIWQIVIAVKRKVKR